ncbi:MAG: tetratricopeptide repeat protein [Dehalococcoidia bacterium]
MTAPNTESFLSQSVFAMSLNNLANRLSEVGRREEALAPAEEAAAIYRELAESNPAVYRPDLAGTLNNLANRLSEVGRREEALAPAEEAAAIYRELAESNPAVYRPDLARTLNNLANRLSEVGRREEALAPAEEAAAIYRELAESNPLRFGSDLSDALTQLAAWSDDLRLAAQAAWLTVHLPVSADVTHRALGLLFDLVPTGSPLEAIVAATASLLVPARSHDASPDLPEALSVMLAQAAVAAGAPDTSDGVEEWYQARRLDEPAVILSDFDRHLEQLVPTEAWKFDRSRLGWEALA